MVTHTVWTSPLTTLLETLTMYGVTAIQYADETSLIGQDKQVKKKKKDVENKVLRGVRYLGDHNFKDQSLHAPFRNVI